MPCDCVREACGFSTYSPTAILDFPGFVVASVARAKVSLNRPEKFSKLPEAASERASEANEQAIERAGRT